MRRGSWSQPLASPSHYEDVNRYRAAVDTAGPLRTMSCAPVLPVPYWDYLLAPLVTNVFGLGLKRNGVWVETWAVVRKHGVGAATKVQHDYMRNLITPPRCGCMNNTDRYESRTVIECHRYRYNLPAHVGTYVHTPRLIDPSSSSNSALQTPTLMCGRPAARPH